MRLWITALLLVAGTILSGCEKPDGVSEILEDGVLDDLKITYRYVGATPTLTSQWVLFPGGCLREHTTEYDGRTSTSSFYLAEHDLAVLGERVRALLASRSLNVSSDDFTSNITYVSLSAYQGTRNVSFTSRSGSPEVEDFFADFSQLRSNAGVCE